MGAGQCDTISHARLLRPQPQPHQRPMRAAIRSNDTSSALCVVDGLLVHPENPRDGTVGDTVPVHD